PLHHLPVVASGVRRRGRDRARDPPTHAADGGHSGRARRSARPRGDGLVRGRSRARRVRRPAIRRVGLRAVEAGGSGVAGADAGAGPEIVTWPMLLAGLGVGALASQLGSVTVSSVPDGESGELGGLQKTLTNLGASIGTALAGAVLISALSSSFFNGIQNNSKIPENVSSKAQVELAAGIPFVSD